MKKGFTLIELLAVIVILAVIAVIAVPIVIDIIKDTKLAAVKRSSELYIEAVELTLAKSKLDNVDLTTCNKIEEGNLICGESKYEVEVNGEHPEYIEIKSDERGKTSFVIQTEGFCIIKTEEDESIKYKRIVDSIKNNEEEIKINMCSLNPYTTEDCFAFDESTGTITKYYNNENNDSKNPACPKNVVIPRKINGVEVKIIGNSAFHGSALTSVEIPNTVTTIKRQAISYNSIKELIIPEGVTTIESHAFQNCGIEKLSLPSTLTSLDPQAFALNKLPQENAYFYKRNSDGSIDYSTIIGYGGANAEGGKDIIIPREKNGIKLTMIGGNAFHGSALTSVEIPNTVNKIDSYAFYNCSLKEIVIPEGVTTIGSYAFEKCGIEKISLPSTLTLISTKAFAFNKLPQESAYIYKRNSDGSIDYSTIIGYGGSNAEGGKNIIIPSEKNGVKLTTIGGGAFHGIDLISVEIPNTVNKIDIDAFSYNSLKEIVIPEGVTTIGQNVFRNNPLESVIIKNSQNNVTFSGNTFGTFDTSKIIWEPIE